MIPLKMHSMPHQKVSHQFQESLRSCTEAGNKPETPEHKRDLHLLAVSLVSLPHHHLQTCPPGLLSHSLEFQVVYLNCHGSPKEGKRVDEKFRTSWKVPHTVGALDRNHIAL